MRRTTVGALAAGIAAAGLVAPVLDSSPGWTPVERGLSEAPAAMLPATVNAAQPVRVVTTALDDEGRPVTTTRTATDRASAERLIRAGRTTPNAVAVELDAPAYLLGSDTYRAQQWAPTTIRATSAWATSTGAGVTVAVIDSGVDAAHPDLAGQVLPGIDLVTGTAGTSSDPNGHGTHVAGTIGALTGNDLGVAGIAPGVKILPVRTQNANGSGMMSAVATGITWAADHGARVINMSLGSTVRVTAVTNAIAYARSKGVVVVASAGNSREQGSPVMYPAADPGVIAVAATAADDRVASFSNAGSYVDVAAPGVSILNTIPVAKGNYAYYSGTSMASPHVAALAALIGAYRPGLTPDQVEQAMEISAVDLGTAGRDADYGYGRVDAVAALAAAGATSSAPAATPTRTATTTPTATPTTTAPAPAPTPTTTTPAPAPTPTPTPTPTKSTTTPPPPVKVSPVITSDGRSQTVTYGATVTTTFTVTAGGAAFAGKPARLCLAERAATTLTCRSVTTSATGTVVLKRTVTAPYRVALTVPATTTNHAATSPTYAYTVRATATLSVRNAATLVAAVNGVNGQLVRLQRLDGSRWTTVKTFRAASSTTLSRTARGTYRMVVPDTASIIGVATRAVSL